MFIITFVSLIALSGLPVGVFSTLSSQPWAAQQPASSNSSRIEVCKLVPKEEVKKHLPWQSFLDQMPITEEPIGASGSSCNYPTADIQVLPFTQSFLDSMRKAGAKESIPGLGDEAYFRNNNNLYAEIVVKVGQRLLTIQADADDNVDAAKPKVIALAREIVPKLR